MGLYDRSQFPFAPVQLIERTRHGTLIKDGSGAFCYGIAKLEPAMGVVE